tara:strand:- start:362 stop:541 length:180 start_codon:yes stop_codon:yes gene_type:complete
MAKRSKKQKVKDPTPMTSMATLPKHLYQIGDLKVEQSVKKAKEVKEKDIFETPKNKSGY